MLQSVENHYKGKIEQISEITISVPRDPGVSKNWTIRFHLPKGK